MIYLDNTQTTRPTSSALETHARISKMHWQDVSAPYFLDSGLHKEIHEAKEALYDLVGARDDDLFIYTRGEAESAALIFQALLLDVMQKSGKNHMITTQIENAALLKSMEELEKNGVEVDYLEVNSDGLIDLEELKEAINPRTAMVALSWVNSLTGVMQPVWEIGALCKELDVLTFVAASEIFAKLSFRFQDLPIDILAFSGDKIHGPKATGGLFCKKETAISFPYRGKELDDVAGFISLGVAAKEVFGSIDFMGTEVARLAAEFEDRLRASVLDVEFFAQNTSRIPNIITFRVPGIHSEALLFYLNERKIKASIGGGDRQTLFRVLRCMKVDAVRARGAISCSLSMFTTDEEIERAVAAIEDAALALKKVSHV